jgi:cytochrome P450
MATQAPQETPPAVCPVSRQPSVTTKSIAPPAPIPTVSRLRSLADSPAMAADPVSVLSKYTEQYGETFRFYIGGIKEAIVTIDPAVIQHVLKTNAENYQKSEIQVKRMGHFLGKGLLTTHGEAWKTQRRLIQKGFDRKQLEALSAIMQNSLAESLRGFDSEIKTGPVDIYPHLMKMTFAMVARSLFGAKLKDEDIEAVSRTICTVQEFIVRQTLQPYLNPWFEVSGELHKHEEMRASADAILMEYIKTRRQQPPGNDLLQTLMDARYSDGEGMSDELVLSESMQLLVAGHETSSNGLSWLLYLLSTRPGTLEQVRQEIDSVLGDAPLTFSDVPRLEFTTQVIQEGLRLYPPFWMIDRMAVADDRVGDVAIPAGSTVIVFVYGAHHAPRRWRDPEEFDPERFTKANQKLLTPFTHLPFGGGPRGCIGNNYAMLQVLMILSEVLRKYDFEVVPGQAIEARAVVILRPKNGIRMSFRQAVPREAPASVSA